MSFYNKVEIIPQINYLIDLAEEPMIADGSYTGEVTVEYALQSQAAYFVTDDAAVDVKDGKATIRLIVNKDYACGETGNLYYAIYGKRDKLADKYRNAGPCKRGKTELCFFGNNRPASSDLYWNFSQHE